MPDIVDRRLSRKDRAMLNLAKKVAETSMCTQKHGAVIVRGGRVLSLGVNKQRNDTMVYSPLTDRVTTHAEMDALSRVKNPHGATIYVARVNNLGEDRYSRPCDNCYKQLVAVGIKRIVYTEEYYMKGNS